MTDSIGAKHTTPALTLRSLPLPLQDSRLLALHRPCGVWGAAPEANQVSIRILPARGHFGTVVEYSTIVLMISLWTVSTVWAISADPVRGIAAARVGENFQTIRNGQCLNRVLRVTNHHQYLMYYEAP